MYSEEYEKAIKYNTFKSEPLSEDFLRDSAQKHEVFNDPDGHHLLSVHPGIYADWFDERRHSPTFTHIIRHGEYKPDRYTDNNNLNTFTDDLDMESRFGYGYNSKSRLSLSKAHSELLHDYPICTASCTHSPTKDRITLHIPTSSTNKLHVFELHDTPTNISNMLEQLKQEGIHHAEY